MFCPKCGQQVSDQVRFCTGCGLRLTAVKQLLSQDDEADGTSSPDHPLHLRRKDLNLGAAAMYLGSLFALFVAVFYGGAHQQGSIEGLFAISSAVVWDFLTNAAVLAALLVGFRFSTRQRDLSLGATLLFIGGVLTSFAVPALNVVNLDSVEAFGTMKLIVVTMIFILIQLFGQSLMQRMLRGIFNLFAEQSQSSRSITTSEKESAAEALLPPGQSVPAKPFINQGATTKQMRRLPEVTADATQLLEKEPHSPA
jgi:hypothetical protein